MGLVIRQILTLLVIVFFTDSLNAWRDYPVLASCESDKDCLKGDAVCIRRECHCVEPYAFGDGQIACQRGDRCAAEHWGMNPCKMGWSEEVSKNSHCLMKDGIASCKCDFGYFGRWRDPYCMASAKIGGKYPCLTDKHCPTYSHCVNNLCACRFEYYGDGEKCKAYAPPACTYDKDCPGKPSSFEKAKCIERTCRCVGMYAGNGYYCRAANSCPHMSKKCGSNAYCMIDPLHPKSHLCACKEGFWKDKNGNCVDCFTNRQCRQRYSICIKGKCGCKEELRLGKTKCEAAPFHKCKTDYDCHSRAKCERGRCICQGKYVGNGKYCREGKPCPNKKCSRATCLIDPLMVRDIHCKCNAGFYYSNTGKSCVECLANVDCNYDENSGKCVNGECKCKDELIREGKECKPAPIQVCRADFDCDAKAKCLQGKCICQGWYIGNGKYCRASRPCDHTKNHCGSHGVCLLDPLLLKRPHCRCEEGYKVFNESGKCLECSSNKECNTNYSTCVDGECKCMDELIKDGKTCRHPRLHLCELQNDCHRNAKCVMKRCYCQGHRTGNGLFCRNSLPCPEGFRCGKHSTCVVDPLFPQTPDCKCDPGYKKSNGSCVEMSNCEKKGLECPDGAICGVVSGGTMGCICEKGYKTIFKNDQLTCEDIDECATGKARCSGNRCTNTIGSYTCIPCPSGFTDGANGLCIGTFKCKCKKHEVCRRGKFKCKTGYKRTKQAQCIGGNRDGLGVQPSSGNSSHFACHLSVFMALGLLGRLAFSTKEE
ncbi:uncharacterized protein LOC144657744 [Oculina patagonica]